LWFDTGSLTNPGNKKIKYPTFAQLVAAGLNYSVAFFNANKTNGVKYIKLNRIDSGGLDQSPYLQQLQTITLTYPDRTPVTYNIAGVQNAGDYFTYNIGPYSPGSMTNFNTSSAGDILDYGFTLGTSPSGENVAADLGNAINGGPFFFALTSNTLPTFGNGISGSIANLILRNALYFYPTRTINSNYTVSFTVNITNNTGDTRRIRAFVAPTLPTAPNMAGSQDINIPNGATTPCNFNFTANDLISISGSNFAALYGNTPIFYYIGMSADIPTPTSNLTFASNPTITFSQSPSEFNGSSSLTLFDPYVPNFDYNEYNALINNAETPQTSVFFMDIDYSQNPVIPVNQSLILEGDADRAQVQDSNYASKAWSNIRYNGSKTNSFRVIS
jgi:hypothetical protein